MSTINIKRKLLILCVHSIKWSCIFRFSLQISCQAFSLLIMHFHCWYSQNTHRNIATDIYLIATKYKGIVRKAHPTQGDTSWATWLKVLVKKVAQFSLYATWYILILKEYSCIIKITKRSHKHLSSNILNWSEKDVMCISAPCSA